MKIHGVLRKNSNLLATVLRPKRHFGITTAIGGNNGTTCRAGSSRMISFSKYMPTKPVYQEQRLLYETDFPHLSSWNDEDSRKDKAARKKIVSFFCHTSISSFLFIQINS